MTARTILPAFVLAFGCTRSSGDFWLVLGTEPGSGVRLSAAVVSPADALVERRADPRGVALRLRSDRGPLRVSAPGGCPLVVEAPGQTVGFVERRVEPLFDLGPKARVVGPEQRFEIRAFERCDEAKSSRLEFRIPSDAPLDDVRIENGGRTLSAKTRGLDRLRRRPAWGIVPVSAARRSMTEITARATFPKGEPLERTIEVSALSRSSGLSSIAEGHPVLLAGSGFRLQKKPEGSRAGLRPVGELTELVPDVRGDFELADGVGRKLVIQSGRYDEMPLDCGR
jgi:hypothetical protein